jgi:hypothetical protein
MGSDGGEIEEIVHSCRLRARFFEEDARVEESKKTC